ncbi:similar to Saccharomyces cerevisiae YLR026C SED5 cis-Golgi t-SNARE syntaxin required for vesicular transport between the ER and the Golgi complex, binds at least 9 SNARE proteins [Maudiozyma barnettii]|uniref:Similar to Saccharomyces cerevisiae YLR026C SED5 cis-Golgi t-SNARE syntaxin required for vesicular transport between the ER and the Golgi complex, binds at least 9 SNARE proteins n=1 Tax=Maudiozyma barnettii TaxID=61262 RepID=A0A8H2VKM6_9SACH|nr:t-SNARE syntaxin [Kazachstania barnettii]CAB4257116.1 similar to Saccharomyces cerevisiae YLR026C SED5 cis-Golgi t-SNARE syntaxin required for vesicular transport between the ER and the Golgi complex, binds at least 9 SNARE proteins [Kazachstania barnettii]CAD1779486.1 similar to Saccharomyces cerevisiae YLR026C SED5 cis-Golgi t-SNARE syntaxin required for vesicular transport between the ER and the Golgi complex, binds at least 9 SNARE proteins [Kazachstania barnettii]
MDIRDRTSEFQRSVVTYKKLNKARSKQVAEEVHVKPKQSEFQKNASLIAHDISETAQLLSKLAILAKRKPMFNDNPVEIAELSFLIKRKIYSVEQQLIKLNQQIHGPDAQLTKTTGGHSSNVMNLLNRKMKNISGDFKSVLEERQKLEISNRDRWDKLSEQHQTNNQQQTTANGNDTANGSSNDRSNMNIGYNNSNPFMTTMMEEDSQIHSQQEGKTGNDQSLILPDSDSQLLMMEEGLSNNQYLQERNRAVETIETTIQEVGNLFQQLASMVQEQGEVIQRIDANVDDVDMNISGAQRELLKYFDRVKSNRWLAVKIFFIIFVFFLLWVLVN